MWHGSARQRELDCWQVRERGIRLLPFSSAADDGLAQLRPKRPIMRTKRRGSHKLARTAQTPTPMMLNRCEPYEEEEGSDGALVDQSTVPKLYRSRLTDDAVAQLNASISGSPIHVL